MVEQGNSYLIQEGYLQRTARGRVATLAAYRHFGIEPPSIPQVPATPGLFE